MISSYILIRLALPTSLLSRGGGAVGHGCCTIGVRVTILAGCFVRREEQTASKILWTFLVRSVYENCTAPLLKKHSQSDIISGVVSRPPQLTQRRTLEGRVLCGSLEVNRESHIMSVYLFRVFYKIRKPNLGG